MDIEDINKIDLKELKKLKFFSLALILWGWFACFVLLYACLNEIHAKLYWPIILVITGLSHCYLYTQCRTSGARICILINSLCFLYFSVLSAIVTIIVGYIQPDSSQYGTIAFLLVFVLCIFVCACVLFFASRQKALWGKTRITYRQIKVSCAARLAGIELADKQLPPPIAENSILKWIAILMVYFHSVMLVLVSSILLVMAIHNFQEFLSK